MSHVWKLSHNNHLQALWNPLLQGSRRDLFWSPIVRTVFLPLMELSNLCGNLGREGRSQKHLLKSPSWSPLHVYFWSKQQSGKAGRRSCSHPQMLSCLYAWLNLSEWNSLRPDFQTDLGVRHHIPASALSTQLLFGNIGNMDFSAEHDIYENQKKKYFICSQSNPLSIVKILETCSQNSGTLVFSSMLKYVLFPNEKSFYLTYKNNSCCEEYIK